MNLFAAAKPQNQGQYVGLRWYQREAVDAVHRILGTGVPWVPPQDEPARSTLIVAATGTGKTQMFGAFAAEVNAPVLVLAHRDELITQARGRIEKMTGEYVEIEKAEWSSGDRTRLVVGSVQSVMQDRRLQRLGSQRFKYVIIDEAHHAVATSYKKVLSYFSDAKVLGVTATPDRADEAALGQSFDEVAYLYDIERAIGDGFLVPVRGRRVHLGEIDLSDVGKSGGDLAVNQLDEKMLKAVEGITRKTLELEPDRQGIVFFPGVASAQYAAERFNVLRPGSACFISGETEEMERRQLTRDFKAGKYKYLCNCQIATEGFDAPSCSMVVIGRPTLSRALFAQMVGRGTRPEDGCIAGMDEKGQADQRRAAIDWSGKPDMVVLDFVGNSGRHSLATVEDVLGGNYDEHEIALAKKKANENPGQSVAESLRLARIEIRAMAQRIRPKAQITHTVQDVELFGYRDPEELQEEMGEVGRRFGFKPMSDKQREALRKFGVSKDTIESIGKRQASAMLDRLFRMNDERRGKGLATLGQLRVLKKYGFTDQNITEGRAAALLNYMAGKSWRAQDFDRSAMERIAHFERQPGED